MMHLNFDWDSVGLEDILVQDGLAKLSQDFPNYDVYYRISASQNGIHAMISPRDTNPPRPIDVDAEEAFKYRREMVDFGLEDEWRLKGDEARLRMGQPTAQLWLWKNGERAGDWVRYNVE